MVDTVYYIEAYVEAAGGLGWSLLEWLMSFGS